MRAQGNDEELRRADRIVGGAEWLLQRAMLVAALFFIFAFLYVSARRIGYPYELEWMEGLGVEAVSRVLAGAPLYGEPSVDYVPSVYPPLYHYLCAPLSALLGGGLLPLRLVSVVASLGCLALVALFVRRETGDNGAALLAGGLFMATFEQSGSWFDVARTDSVSLCLALTGLYLLRFKPTARWTVVAAAAVLLSLLAKQTAAAMALSFVLCVAVQQGARRGLVVGAALSAAAGAVVLVMHQVSGGWSTWFLFEMPAQHDFRWEALHEYWTVDLAAVAVAGAVGLFFVLDRVHRREHRTLAFYVLLALGPLAAAWLSRLHGGGFRNVLMPAFAAASILFGLGYHGAGRFFSDLDGLRRRLLGALTALLCLAQLLSLLYDLPAQIPTEGDRRGGDAVVARLRAVDGDTLMMWHGHLPALAGSHGQGLGMSLSDVLRAEDDDVRQALVADIEGAIRSHRYAAIVVDSASGFFEGHFDEAIADCYGPGEPLLDDPDAFWPVTGFHTRPETIHFPRQGPGCGPR